MVPETVLRTVLIEVEGIMNAKPLGNLLSDVADPDPLTPNILIMGHQDSSIPQALYDSTNLLGTRRWKPSQVLADHFRSTFTRHYLPTGKTEVEKGWKRLVSWTGSPHCQPTAPTSTLASRESHADVSWT